MPTPTLEKQIKRQEQICRGHDDLIKNNGLYLDAEDMVYINTDKAILASLERLREIEKEEGR